MTQPEKNISVVALRRLLVELKEHRPDICIRYRLIGKMWAEHFLRIIRMTEQGVVVNDETSNELINIPDLSHIMQMELDKPFQIYQPYFHYDIITTGEW